MKSAIMLAAAVLILVSCASCVGRGRDNPEAEKPAIAAADQWLALIDAEDYAQSWEEAAPYFQKNVSEEEWAQQAGGAREPLGAVESREVRNSAYHASMPGAPDGEYVIIQYQTTFENKDSAVETVTPMKVDGEWRVSGYYVK